MHFVHEAYLKYQEEMKGDHHVEVYCQFCDEQSKTVRFNLEKYPKSSRIIGMKCPKCKQYTANHFVGELRVIDEILAEFHNLLRREFGKYGIGVSARITTKLHISGDSRSIELHIPTEKGEKF